MDLTKKQLEIMDLFWESAVPLTIPALVAVSGNRSWSVASIHRMIAQLEAKGVLAVYGDSSVHIKSYKPMITCGQYLARHTYAINQDRKQSVRLTIDAIIEEFKQVKAERENKV